MSTESPHEAIAASQRLLDRGELGAAQSALHGHEGREVDLQRGAIAVEAVLLDGGAPTDVVTILTPHIESGRAVDLIGMAHFHAAITTGDHSLPEAIGECTSASRMSFDQPRWNVANLLHIGMIQQRQGSYDIALVYLEDAYERTREWPAEHAMAAHHLGLDARARGDDDEAVRLLEEALDLRRIDNHTVSIPASLLALAETLRERERAGKLIDEAVDVSRRLRVRRPLAVALLARGLHRSRPGDLAEARALATELSDRRLVRAIDDRL